MSRWLALSIALNAMTLTIVAIVALLFVGRFSALEGDISGIYVAVGAREETFTQEDGTTGIIRYAPILTTLTDIENEIRSLCRQVSNSVLC